MFSTLKYCALFLIIAASLVYARSNYRGYSGAPGTLGTCASSCHGGANGAVEITGFPASYVPDSTYLISITAVSGQSINNFNASVREGTGSTNAGTLSSGTNVSAYIVAGETNGVHLTTNNHTNGTFNWLAPPAGTGTVRLYAGTFQGTNMNSGQNTSIELIADEAVIETPPGFATNPNPADMTENLDVDFAALSWSPAERADSYEVFLGDGAFPDMSLGVTAETSFPIASYLDFSISYVWRVDAINEYGTTQGVTWSFATEPNISVGMPYNPRPADNAMNVPVTTTLSWSAADFATHYDIFIGLDSPTTLVGSTADTTIALSEPLDYSTAFVWHVVAFNDHSQNSSDVWHFTTETQTAIQTSPFASEYNVGQAYPNPFNGIVRISLSTPIQTEVSAIVYDRTGRLVTTLVDRQSLVGEKQLEWNAAGQAAGVYFLRVTGNGFTQTQKLVYLP
jgi:hypothetical protein